MTDIDQSPPLHLVLPLLPLAKRNVLPRRLLVETPPAELALGELRPRRLQQLLLLPARLIVLVSRLLQSCPQLQRLGLPLRHLLSRLLLLQLPLHRLALFNQLFLLIGDDALILRVEGLAFLLENLPANSFVLGNAVRIELSAASFAALHQFGGIVLLYLYSVLAVDLLDVSLLVGAALYLPVVVLSVVVLFVVVLSVVVLLAIILLLPLRLVSLIGLLCAGIVLFLPLLRFLARVVVSLLIFVVPAGLRRLVVVFGVMLLHLLIDILV
jgi:hypothetical protein